MDVSQAATFLQTMTFESGYLDGDDFPRTEQPVWILGKQYSALYDLDEIRADIRSRLWLTYRRGFQSIGNTGLTSDIGWGCMLRCGQMMMAQALMLRYLGRDWKWKSHTYDPKYFDVLQRFLDKRSSCYSIHQIASMGVTEGKGIGEWFGPNTVAQVFRKLAAYDERSNIAVHVALDNTVVIEDIEKMPSTYVVRVIETLCRLSDTRIRKMSGTKQQPQMSKSPYNAAPNGVTTTGAKCNGDAHSPASTDISCKNDSLCDSASKESLSSLDSNVDDNNWRHLLLIVPLRLGLSEMNLLYADSVKACLRLPQSVGLVGGQPNHAHWFIGYVENELIFLDPHTVQPMADMGMETDDSYHYSGIINRVRFQGLDPSTAVGFYCHTERDFREFCRLARKMFAKEQYTAMFEVCQKRPAHWPPFQPYTPGAARFTDLTYDRKYESDEEFELL